MAIVEFYPKVILKTPKGLGVGRCVGGVPMQTKESIDMYHFAKHLIHQYSGDLRLRIPCKSSSKIQLIVKWVKFKARVRLKRLNVEALPALVFDNMVLCTGTIHDKCKIEDKVASFLRNGNN